MARAEVLKVTVEQYHRDPCAKPSLSASIANVLLRQSPLHAWSVHPRYGNHRKESTTSQSLGTLMHRLVLNAGASLIEIKADDYRTNAAKAARDAALAAGRIPVLSAALDEAQTAAQAVLEQLLARGIVLSGRSELALSFEEQPADEEPVQCRAMLDHLVDHQIYDLKTIRSADQRTCESSATSYGYTLAAAAYTRAAELLLDAPGRVNFAFIFVETEPPYAVRVLRPDAAFRAVGLEEWDRAVDVWAECTRLGFWPGYTDGQISLPSWKMPMRLPDSDE